MLVASPPCPMRVARQQIEVIGTPLQAVNVSRQQIEVLVRSGGAFDGSSTLSLVGAASVSAARLGTALSSLDFLSIAGCGQSHSSEATSPISLDYALGAETCQQSNSQR